MQRTWWKEAVVYEIYIRSFQDSNGDGIGDLQGITSRIPYLKDLGIDAVWITPFFESPCDDMGYDISDYEKVSQDYGTMEDFDELIAVAHDHGIQVIVDMVLNHTSDEHSWFLESRSSKDNPKRDWYVWHPGINGEPPNNWPSAFQGSAWEWDEQTGEYYLHQFSKKQPDLNWRNPEVKEAMFKMLRFWLDKGVDGLRLDVINALVEDEDWRNNVFKETGQVVDYNQVQNDQGFSFDRVLDYTRNQPETFEVVEEMRKKVLDKYGEIFTVGESFPCSTDDAKRMTGENRLNVVFHFEFLFLGKIDVLKFKEIISRWDSSLKERGASSWNAYYLSNHDMPRQVSVFGSEQYHKASAKLLAALLLTLHGTIFLFQGEEIGMTNVQFPKIENYRDIMCLNLYKKLLADGAEPEAALQEVWKMSRDNARTPMQWNEEPHAGFTPGEPWLKVNPNYHELNVAAQQKDPDSILNYYKELISLRKKYKTLVYGRYLPLMEEDHQVMAYLRADEEALILVALNMTAEKAELNLPEDIDLSSAELLLCNLTNDATQELQPYEARIYRLN